MNKIAVKNEVIESIYSEISQIISETKTRVQTNLNSEMVLLYWHIGEHIENEILIKNESNYGKEVVKKPKQ